MKTHKEYLDKQLSDKEFADGFYREKEELKMNKEYAEKVNAMTDEELCVKAAELMGLNVVHKSWPCGRPPESCSLEADQMPIKGVGGWTTDSPDWYDKEWPVYLDGNDEYWPPKWCEDNSDWMTAVEPIPDCLNDMSAAWELVMANPDWRWSIYELDNGDWCASPLEVIGVRGEHCLWDHVSEATGETAQRAITKAFILAMEAND